MIINDSYGLLDNGLIYVNELFVKPTVRLRNDKELE